MQVIDNIQDFEKPCFSVVTIGTFDGVHVGHQAILKQLITEAETHNGKSVVITFWPHPRFILKKDADALKLLSSFDEKTEVLRSLDLDYLIKIPFTPQFSNLSANDFVKEILVDQIGTKKLFIGYDHHFGNNRKGDIHFLNEMSFDFGYEVHEIPRHSIDDIGVSSTKIRNYLHNGEVQLANALLGRQYSITGTIIDGEKRGRTIGFPTANIKIKENYKLLPSDGAYAIKAKVDDLKLRGMLNIGFNPTVSGRERTIEAHLFNFEETIYGRDITIEFVRLLRKEMRFDSVEHLKEQLIIDKKEAINTLS